ncbi:hypothetical protein QTP70_008890 [Hemibagrus guttatus]|uniref:FYVE-type domain-containing protein n=1 Tax=Hemibagrus guttatus TaxID=175788 RepID=A0AAE0Q0Q0_9TELE|nr:hypothetical protein QTP70_008890 [Hemibagrus guttatus]
MGEGQVENVRKDPCKLLSKCPQNTSRDAIGASSLDWLMVCRRRLHQQFEMYKDQVKKLGDEAQNIQEQKSDSPICGICHKTKFADGCGHVCSYCQTKFCARCGGRVSLRSNKIMGVCNLCRKQQEILIKSGAWFYGGAEGRKLGPEVKGHLDSSGLAVKSATGVPADR